MYVMCFLSTGHLTFPSGKSLLTCEEANKIEDKHRWTRITGCWFKPIWKILVSWDYYSQYRDLWMFIQHNWLLVDSGWPTPLKKYEFVSWDDFPFPTEWKVIKVHGSKAPTRLCAFSKWLAPAPHPASPPFESAPRLRLNQGSLLQSDECCPPCLWRRPVSVCLLESRH